MTQDNSTAQLVDAPEHIWLLDYGSGECVWCNCPAPDAEDHEPVKYVRADLIEALTRVQPSTSSVEAVARAIMEAQPYNLSPDEAMNCARAVLALPSPEREPMREAWQLIESAPRGEEVFVANHSYRRLASLNPHGVWFVMEGGRVKFDGVRLVQLDFEPTHWMPLPAPPPAQSGDRT